MEEPGDGAAPSGAEREKLREKLALLRREYSETVSRLRRARRAERVQGIVRKTVAEQNRLLGGQEAARSPAGSRDTVSPTAGKHETCQLQIKSCSVPGTKKKTSVTFKQKPEFSNNQVSLSNSSQAESTQASQENVCSGVVRPAAEKKKTKTSRGMMKLRRRRMKTVVPEETESVHDVLLINTDEKVKNQAANKEELGSPVFRQSSFSNTEENAHNTHRASRPALVRREENSSAPLGVELGVVQETLEDRIDVGVPELFSCALTDSNDVQQPGPPSAVVMSDNCEPAQLCLENSESILPDTSDDGGKEPSSIKKQTVNESTCEDQGELCRLLDLMSEKEVLPADRNNTVINESENPEGNQNDTNGLNRFPTDSLTGNVEKLLETQELETESRLSHLENVTTPETESALNSCTVIEGLLFPVEYYVRTTRRMSNCQRKVDLDAVILSQLGRSKKGLRNKCKQKDANSDRPSQETVENDEESGFMPLPFLGAENNPVDSSSPRQSLPPSNSSSTSLGSISQNSTASTKHDQRRSQRKQKGRRRSVRKATVNQASQELLVGLDLVTPKESSSVLSNDYQSKKENSEGNLEKSSLDEIWLSGAAALGSGETEAPGAMQPVSADSSSVGSQVLGKCHKTVIEQVQNPLQKSDSLNPGKEAFASCIGDLDANLSVCQSDKHPVEHVKNRHVREACRAEPLLGIDECLSPHRPLRSSARQRARQLLKGESKRGHSHQMDSEDPASLGLPTMDPDSADSLFSFRSVQWLPSRLGIKDFHLPDEEFGLLKLEKFKSSPVNDLEVFVPSTSGDGVASDNTQDLQMNAEKKKQESNLISPFKNALSKLPHLESPASKKGLCTDGLLFTPTETVLAGAPSQPESQISSSVFPVLGATPAVLPSVHSTTFPTSPSVLPVQVNSHSSKGASAQVVDRRECRDSAIPLDSDSCGAESARKEEGQCATFHLEAERDPNHRSDEMMALKKHQQSESEQQGSCRAPVEQEKTVAEPLAVVLLDGLREESLQLVSKLKDSSRSCAVDVSTMWWEAAGCRELCVVTACESSVSLWKLLASGHWGKVYTWQPGEIPVIQIIPLPDTCNLVCIALGNLEIGEIRLLLYSSENDSFKQSLVKTGNIKAVLGLKDRRLVSSSRTAQEQQVEIMSFSETGRNKEGQTLMPPEETVLAFAEVEGMRDALVGTTAVNSIVVWNLKTGQLLKKMHVGYSYPASICHRAYSDSGLLFVVLSHPHAKESELCGNPAFRVIAFNPKTARSTGVIFSSLPPGHAGRYLEGEVKDASAAAVLTSGTIAVWDLLLGQCTALLPPNSNGSWSLVRWSVTSAGLLAGQKDGSVYLYRYSQPKAEKTLKEDWSGAERRVC